MINNSIDDNGYENQLLVSFELICLIKWILENEDEKMKKIIVRALNSGLQEELNKKTVLSKEEILDDIQSVLFDFFDMMEGLLTESISEQAVKRVIEKNLMPSIDKIDSSICDDETVRFSIEKTASKLENNYVNADNNCRLDGTLIENYPATKKEITSKEKAKKILMSELLKHWKPKGKSVLN
ncbi:MAG: hypothetical protein UR12_C0051G0002 [candidate division TM6 bacterium GW2011_GWF2_30_66]|jgi:hypothetical protein|nr:MAG: hypothetical protein UR12_C0051G0002 [candidate division TM6 bacterium GW2011_GWF2_30_66]